MVTISKALSSGQAQSYHKLEYTSEQQSYYKEGERVKGEWQGKLATKFGLTGEVTAQEFSRLAEGKHPQTEETLVRHRNGGEYAREDGSIVKEAEHRAGWDATFSAPKSVSLTALVGGDDRVREAHREAVTAALTELERYTQARIGGNHEAETTGRFIAAKFEHDTARPVDGYAAPQLHTHAVLFNVTERADGTTRALQERAFFETQNFATAVYQSALTYKLRELGYEIETGKSGAPEIKGYSQQYLDASSPRSRQIKDAVEKSGYSGPEAAEIAAHATRDRKVQLSPAEVLTAHQEMASAFGNEAEQVVARARLQQKLERTPTDAQDRAREAVTFARSGIYEREAVADERLIQRDALRRGMGETTYAEVRAEFELRRERGDFRSVEGPKHSSGRSFTTGETLAAERANIGSIASGRDAVQPMLAEDSAHSLAATRAFLNTSQRSAIVEVLTSPDRIHGLQGLAGAGKTTTLEVIRQGAETSGYTVEGFAPTARAAAQLRDSGIDAATVQSFLARPVSPDAPAKHLYILDESSLAGSRQMRAFLDKFGPEHRVLLVGDTRQHQGVDAGRPFQQMQEAGMRTSQLDTIVRQKDPELLKAVHHLATGETQHGVALLAEQGRVTQIPNATERIAAIARDYAASPENTIVVSPDNRSREAINQAIRVEMLANGTLGHDAQTFQTLAHRSDMTGADRTWAARYNRGDVLQYITGSKREGIERDSFATVRAVDARANTLTVETAQGESVTYDPRRLRGVNAFSVAEREFATGDRLQFTANDKTLAVANRDLGTVTAIEEGRITVRLDGKEGRSVSFDPTALRQFDHGYAVTSHSSQGLTTGRVLANIDTESSRTLINSRLAYVALSRASHDARIYTNNAETLGVRLATEVTKTAALDFKTIAPRETAIDAFRDHDPVEATRLLQQEGRLHRYADREHRLAAVAIDYASTPTRAIVVSPSAEERRELNTLIRQELQSQGRLATESRTLPVTVEASFGNRSLAANYGVGDTVVYKTGSPERLGIAHGSMATVSRIDAKQNRLSVTTTSDEIIVYNPAQEKELTAGSRVYRQESREIAQGERIQLTAPDPENRFRSRSFATVEKIGEDNGITARLDNGKSVTLSPTQARSIEYGYAVESSRGVPAERVIVTGETAQLVKTQAALVGLHPSTRDLAIYTNNAVAAQEKEAVASLQQRAGAAFGSKDPATAIYARELPSMEKTRHTAQDRVDMVESPSGIVHITVNNRTPDGHRVSIPQHPHISPALTPEGPVTGPSIEPAAAQLPAPEIDYSGYGHGL